MPNFTIKKFDSSKKYLKVKYPSKKVISYFYDNNERKYKVEIIRYEEKFMKLGVIKTTVMDVETINMLDMFFSSDKADSTKLEVLLEKSKTCMLDTSGETGIKFCSSPVGGSHVFKESQHEREQLESQIEIRENFSNKVYKKTTIGGYEYYGEDGHFVIIKYLDKPSKYVEKVFSYKPGSQINYKTSFMNDQSGVGTRNKITISGLDNIVNVFCTEQINTIVEQNSPEFRALGKLIKGEKLTIEDIDSMSFWSGLNSS